MDFDSLFDVLFVPVLYAFMGSAIVAGIAVLCMYFRQQRPTHRSKNKCMVS
jgi:hypothetical protein